MEAKQNWHSLSQASRILGKDRSYVSKWLIRHETLPDNMVMEIGNAKVINDSGIQWIIEHTKKEDVHISSCVLIVDKFLKLTVLGNVLCFILHGRVRGNQYKYRKEMSI